jgi:hypothetical protein
MIFYAKDAPLVARVHFMSSLSIQAQPNTSNIVADQGFENALASQNALITMAKLDGTTIIGGLNKTDKPHIDPSKVTITIAEGAEVQYNSFVEGHSRAFLTVAAVPPGAPMLLTGDNVGRLGFGSHEFDFPKHNLKELTFNLGPKNIGAAMAGTIHITTTTPTQNKMSQYVVNVRPLRKDEITLKIAQNVQESTAKGEHKLALITTNEATSGVIPEGILNDYRLVKANGLSTGLDNLVNVTAEDNHSVDIPREILDMHATLFPISES